jgi:hypothetical protein
MTTYNIAIEYDSTEKEFNVTAEMRHSPMNAFVSDKCIQSALNKAAEKIHELERCTENDF